MRDDDDHTTWELSESFSRWDFDGEPVAAAATAELVMRDWLDEAWLMIALSADRTIGGGDPQTAYFEIALHAWEGDLSLRRPLRETLREAADYYDADQLRKLLADLDWAADRIRASLAAEAEG